MEVLMAVGKDIRNNIIDENQIDLVNHAWFMILEFWKRNPVSGKYPKKQKCLIIMIIKLAMDTFGKSPVLQYNKLFKIFFGG